MKGADSSLSTVVTEAVRTELGQSNVFTIMPPATVAAALAPHAAAGDEPRRSRRSRARSRSAKAPRPSSTATSRRSASGFVVSLRLVTADSGTELASFHETADARRELLPTLDKLVRELRGKMGESLKTVHAEPPLEQLTTTSLDALRKLAEARRANNIEGDFAKSISLLEQAVAIDSTFAMAYRSLGVAYSNLRVSRDKQDSAYAKAYRFRDHLTERERLLTTADYFGGPARDRSREVAALQDYIARYPTDYTMYNNLGLRLDGRRAWAPAESAYRRSVALAPDATLQYGNLLRNLVSQGRFDDAAAVESEMQRRFPGTPVTQSVIGQIDLGKGLFDSAVAKMTPVRASSSSPLIRQRFDETFAAVALTHGRLADAAKLRQQSVTENAALGVPASPLQAATEDARVDTWFREQPARAVADPRQCHRAHAVAHTARRPAERLRNRERLRTRRPPRQGACGARAVRRRRPRHDRSTLAGARTSRRARRDRHRRTQNSRGGRRGAIERSPAGRPRRPLPAVLRRRHRARVRSRRHARLGDRGVRAIHVHDVLESLELASTRPISPAPTNGSANCTKRKATSRRPRRTM